MATKMASREELEESNGKRTLSSSSVNTEYSDTEESTSVEVKRKKKNNKRMKQKSAAKKTKRQEKSQTSSGRTRKSFD